MELNVKKILLVILIIILIVVGISVIIRVNNKNDEKDVNNEKNNVAIGTSEIQELGVKSVTTQYNGENNETTVQLTIENISNEIIEKKMISIIFFNEEEQQLAGVESPIDKIEPQAQYGINILLSGDASEIKKAKIQNTDTPYNVEDNAQENQDDNQDNNQQDNQDNNQQE